MVGAASEMGVPSHAAGMTGGRHCGAEGPMPDEVGRNPGNPMPAGHMASEPLCSFIKI